MKEKELMKRRLGLDGVAGLAFDLCKKFLVEGKVFRDGSSLARFFDPFFRDNIVDESLKRDVILVERKEPRMKLNEEQGHFEVENAGLAIVRMDVVHQLFDVDLEHEKIEQVCKKGVRKSFQIPDKARSEGRRCFTVFLVVLHNVFEDCIFHGSVWRVENGVG